LPSGPDWWATIEEVAMRVLLADGSGLTSKQTALRLAEDGHHVEVLAPRGLNLARCTSSVRAVHPVPPFGRDPFTWLDGALAVWERGSFDVLVPTQEQVAVLALARRRLEEAGVRTAVPTFEALAAVQDKVAAHRTLARLGLPQPEATVVERCGDLITHTDLPLFVKEAVGTASTGVHRVEDRASLDRVAADLDRRGAFGGGGVVVQRPVPGPLVMVQSVFDHGRMVAFHACRRTALGANGGASHKRGVDLPAVREDLARLGGALDWHGALSADVIVGHHGPRIIDVNPRLIEPANAYASGVDLVGALVDVARSSGRPRPGQAAGSIPPGVAGVNTHQLLLGVLGAAVTGGRTGVTGSWSVPPCTAVSTGTAPRS
jgi:hypothetical protein